MLLETGRPVRNDTLELGVEEVRQAHSCPRGSHLQLTMDIVGHIADLDHLAHPLILLHVIHMCPCE